MKNSNFDWHLESAMKKLTIEEKVWSLGQVADRLERELLRKPNAIHLGPNNVVRQEALEVKPRKPLLSTLTHPLDNSKDSISQRVGFVCLIMMGVPGQLEPYALWSRACCTVYMTLFAYARV